MPLPFGLLKVGLVQPDCIAGQRSWQSAYRDEQVRCCCCASLKQLVAPAVRQGGMCACAEAVRSHPLLPPVTCPLQIALISVEEFSEHPLAAENGLSGESDPHQLMLNRLKHEVAYR